MTRTTCSASRPARDQRRSRASWTRRPTPRAHHVQPETVTTCSGSRPAAQALPALHLFPLFQETTNRKSPRRIDARSPAALQPVNLLQIVKKDHATIKRRPASDLLRLQPWKPEKPAARLPPAARSPAKSKNKPIDKRNRRLYYVLLLSGNLKVKCL